MVKVTLEKALELSGLGFRGGPSPRASVLQHFWLPQRQADHRADTGRWTGIKGFYKGSFKGFEKGSLKGSIECCVESGGEFRTGWGMRIGYAVPHQPKSDQHVIAEA